MEYDHLNYTPPTNKWKQHYQRMANGLSVGNGQPAGATPLAVPPIPPLPKAVAAPAPPPREEEPLTGPPPPKRDEAVTTSDGEEASP